MRAEPIKLALSPTQAMAGWPLEVPLAALISGSAEGVRSRWSILASPAHSRRCEGDAGTHAMDWLRGVLAGTRTPVSESPGPPFRSGWIGYASYDLGRRLEPRAGVRPPETRWPLMEWHRCPGAYVFDNAEDQWWVVGDSTALPSATLLVERQTRRADQIVQASSLKSLTGRAAFEHQVERAVELVHAGDVFQVNLAHCLEGRFTGSARGLYGALSRAAAPWYGAYLESGERAILSLSPELFLHFDARTRRVVTRPMKGTRPAERGGRNSLLMSEKDAAELNMIVDLMRNDLGRVCEYGSVRVEEPRVVERHAGGGVLQGVGTVSGVVRPGLGVPDLLDAAFPPGSVTGAPKIRAMQIIDELEPVRRGPYCGAIGYIGDEGHLALSVAIRTVLLERRGAGTGPEQEWDLRYSVGAGIVADSSPVEEWRETLVKAGPVARVATIDEGAA